MSHNRDPRGLVGSDVDHVTARRVALWLLPRPQQQPDFMRQLIKFAKTGTIT